jgi:hypothetical protein
VRVHVRAGLRVLFDDVLPLGGAPTRTVTGGVVPVARATSARGIGGFFSEGGVSTVAGAAVLLARGGLSDEAVEEAASAGARSILVDGPLPAGAFSLDVPSGVPVVGLPTELARTVRSLHASGIPVTVSVGAAHVVGNTDGGSVAAFSSRGLAFSGVLKPDLVAPGVSVPTSEPGRSDEGEVRYGTVSGTSAAAAVAAGAAAVLAQSRPRASATSLLGLLVGSARRVEGEPAGAAGMLDLQAAVQQEIVVEPAAISLGAASASPELEQSLLVSNLSTRPVVVTVRASESEDAELLPVPDRLRLRAGGSGELVLQAEVDREGSDAVTGGQLVLTVRGSPAVRLPWVVTRPVAVDLLSQVSLQQTGERISDATPAVVSFVAGAIGEGTHPEIRPVELLEVQLWRGSELLGVLSRRRELLPGRYTFGLTGRGPRGERLARGSYVVRLVARPGDGTRRQVEAIDYRVR